MNNNINNNNNSDGNGCVHLSVCKQTLATLPVNNVTEHKFCLHIWNFIFQRSSVLNRKQNERYKLIKTELYL